MFKTSKKTANPSLLEIVMSALEVKWYIPDEPPETALPPGVDRNALRAFTIEEVDGGYVAKIEFDMAPGKTNAIGTPDAYPLPTYREAFLMGAQILCEIVTGSPDLPFLVLDDELMVVSVTANGAPLIMRRPLPTQYA